MLATLFEQQWRALGSGADGKADLLAALRSIAAPRDPHGIYVLMLHALLGSDQALDEKRVVRSATGVHNTTVWKKLYKFQRDGGVGAIEKLVLVLRLKRLRDNWTLYTATKFAVVVPSVAIKEGVVKTLQITREHYETLYPGAAAGGRNSLSTQPARNRSVRSLETADWRPRWTRRCRVHAPCRNRVHAVEVLDRGQAARVRDDARSEEGERGLA